MKILDVKNTPEEIKDIVRGVIEKLSSQQPREQENIEKAWEKIAEKLATLPVGQADTRGMSRFILSGAIETEVDGAGRILLPEYLKEFADLKSRVVLAGVSDRIEIWNEKTWEEYKRRIEKGADQMAQTLGEMGIL